jgi:pSer/pThr/pTyr-binding forkhead associated (FHA) protein
MVLLRRLFGSAAGQEAMVERFPFRVGRGADNHLRVPEPGVWDHHFRLERGKHHALTLHTEPGASTLVNGRPVDDTAVLRLGDVIEAGAAKFSWWLGPVRQRGLTLRETMTWVGLALLVVLQLWLAASLPS